MINCTFLITKQFTLCGQCKENLYTDKLAGAEKVVRQRKLRLNLLMRTMEKIMSEEREIGGGASDSIKMQYTRSAAFPNQTPNPSCHIHCMKEHSYSYNYNNLVMSSYGNKRFIRHQRI